MYTFIFGFCFDTMMYTSLTGHTINYTIIYYKGGDLGGQEEPKPPHFDSRGAKYPLKYRDITELYFMDSSQTEG